METNKIVTLLFFTSLFIGAGCEDESTDTGSIDSCQDFFELEIDESCDFPPDWTIDHIANARGIYEMVHLSSTRSLVTIRPELSNDNIPTCRVVLCNDLSNNFKEGQEIIFSGNLIELYRGSNINVNIIGPPLELTSIKIRCDNF